MAVDVKAIVAAKTAGKNSTASSSVRISEGSSATTKSSSGLFA